MRLVALHTLLFLFSSYLLYSQGEANQWYFGTNAGLNFNGGAPVSIAGGQVNTSEGSASISDPSGNLLFYTDGMTVWNKNHVAMSNGSALLGNSSSTQSGVIIQKPGSATIYYLFASDIQAGSGITYSEIDMSLSGGLGDVVTATKNTVLSSSSCEKITGIRHCNNKDVWLVTHDWGTNTFRTFLITSSGINSATPVLSSVGLTATGSSSEAIGQLKGSPDGSKLASAIWGSAINRFELFDFNNSTGAISNAVLLPQYVASSGAYGVEFSPDSKKLYCSLITPAEIYQFDVCAGSAAAISSSAVKIATSAAGFNGSLQLGPDGKIYSAQYGQTQLGVINSPNAAGLACNYVDNGVSLGLGQSTLGLPNFVPYFFTPEIDEFTFDMECLEGSFSVPDNSFNIGGCSSSPYITSFSWDFDDPSTGPLNTSSLDEPSHTFSTPGTYNVKLTINYRCGDEEVQTKSIEAEECGPVEPPALFSPNCFTPNNDGVNDFFAPKGHKVFENSSLTIYNRWGERIFTSSNPQAGWDGKYNGLVCAQDVYIYRLVLEKGTDGNPHTEVGRVTLLR